MDCDLSYSDVLSFTVWVNLFVSSIYNTLSFLSTMRWLLFEALYQKLYSLCKALTSCIRATSMFLYYAHYFFKFICFVILMCNLYVFFTCNPSISDKANCKTNYLWKKKRVKQNIFHCQTFCKCSMRIHLVLLSSLHQYS